MPKITQPFSYIKQSTVTANTIIVCTKCGVEKPSTDFHKLGGIKRKRLGVHRICKACTSAYHAIRYKGVSGVQRKYQREWYSIRRQQVIQGYGSRCNCCGEAKTQFLTIDHVNNDGAARRRLDKSERPPSIYSKIIRLGFPSDYQLLCANCNLGKRINGGECPHATGA